MHRRYEPLGRAENGAYTRSIQGRFASAILHERKIRVETRSFFGFGLLTLVLAGGCADQEARKATSSIGSSDLDPAISARIEEIVDQEFGPIDHPKPLDEQPINSTLTQGPRLYRRLCANCHGVMGDGAGPAAGWLDPRPRDFGLGAFKFTSTVNGAKPLVEDLLATLRRGVPGTAMPAFKGLDPAEARSLVGYVRILSMRHEFARALVYEAEGESDPDPENFLDQATIESCVDSAREPWDDAAKQVIPLESEPLQFDHANVELGRRAFLSEDLACYKCHAVDGRGQPDDSYAITRDLGDRPARTYDLTTGFLRGGKRREDIARRVLCGVSGGGMPSFEGLFGKWPEATELQTETATATSRRPREDLWRLVSFVQYLSHSRRLAEAPPRGR